jgi:hypothetical protein
MRDHRDVLIVSALAECLTWATATAVAVAVFGAGLGPGHLVGVVTVGLFVRACHRLVVRARGGVA